MTRLPTWPAVALILATGGARADAKAPPPPASALQPVVVTSPVDHPAAGTMRLKYGSRFLCEAAHDKAIANWGLGGFIVGSLGGLCLDTLLVKKKNGYETSVTHGFGWQVGMLVGWPVGWLLGHAFAPDCSALPWTPEEVEKMERYRMAQKTFAECMQRRNRTIAGWTLGCGLSAGLGGMIGGIAVGGHEPLSQILGGVLGFALGSAVGYLTGDLIGRSKAEVCGDPPRPEEFMFSRPATTVPLAPPVSGSPVR